MREGKIRNLYRLFLNEYKVGCEEEIDDGIYWWSYGSWVIVLYDWDREFIKRYGKDQ